jgi:hypothetical protein
MFKQQSTFARLVGGLLFACSAVVFTRLSVNAQNRLSAEPSHESDQSVQPSFEGWWQELDGSYRIMFGYFNRNSAEATDIPIGPNNHIEPGGPDQGQPTHFLTRRHWGMFTIRVPKDFGDKKITWTLVSGGRTLSVPGSLNVLWKINPYSDPQNVTPPTITFDEKGAGHSSPDPLIVTRAASVGQPLTLDVWVADDNKNQIGGGRGGAGTVGGAGGRGGRGGAVVDSGPPSPGQIATPAGVNAEATAQFTPRAPVSLTWSEFRGRGEVTFANNRPAVRKIDNGTIPNPANFNGKGSTTATFSEPGEYTLLVVATNGTGEGGGGFLCCWTNGEVKVAVRERPIK